MGSQPFYFADPGRVPEAFGKRVAVDLQLRDLEPMDPNLNDPISVVSVPHQASSLVHTYKSWVGFFLATVGKC